MADLPDPILQECGACGTLIDVSEEEPFALMHCSNCGASIRVRRQFGRFELQEILGVGGMGAVYRALDTTLNRQAALKLLRREFTQNPEFVRQFEREASITARVNHPNVVKVYSTSSDHELYYIAMELVDKGSLDDLMTLQGAVAEAQALEVGIQIARGLQAAYDCGLIHRDVKPGNILFADAHHAKIVDFGLAAPLEKSGDVGGEIWGTPYYVAPEKLDTPASEDLRSDIYSLGATLFHAMAGRPPYEANDASVVALKHLKSQPVNLHSFAPEISNATAYVIDRTLQKDPDERFATYDDLISNLEYARDELLAASARPQGRERLVLEDEESQRMMSWLTVGILSALLLGGVLLFLFRDAIFGAEKPAVQAVSSHGPISAVPSDLEARYASAQKLLADGLFTEASGAFSTLEEEADLPQPLHNWITLQAALSRILNGHGEEARPLFDRIIGRGPYSFDPAEEKLAAFFLDISKVAAQPRADAASVARDYSKTNYESFALLLLAAKDWELGSFDDGGPLFRQFHSATPEPPWSWIAKYHDLSQRFIDSYAGYREIVDGLRGARTIAEQRAALPKARDALLRLKVKGQLARKAEALVSAFEKECAASEETERKMLAEHEASDTKTLAAVKASTDLLCAQYKYAEAAAVVGGASVFGEGPRLDQQTLLKRMKWLAAFKTLLIKDINATAYPLPILKKNGIQISGGVSKANDTQVEVRTPYGSVPVLWPDLSSESVFAMARSFIRPGIAAEFLAEREWLLGVFAFSVGKSRESRALMADASRSKPEYSGEMALFPEPAESP